MAARRDALEALWNLADLDDGSTFLASKIIYTALATAAALPKEKDHHLCFAALQTIERLAARKENRPTLYSNGTLFRSLLYTLQQKVSVEASIPGSMEESLLEYIFLKEVLEVQRNKGKDTPPIQQQDISTLAGTTLLVISGIDAHRYHV